MKKVSIVGAKQSKNLPAKTLPLFFCEHSVVA